MADGGTVGDGCFTDARWAWTTGDTYRLSVICHPPSVIRREFAENRGIGYVNSTLGGTDLIARRSSKLTGGGWPRKGQAAGLLLAICVASAHALAAPGHTGGGANTLTCRLS